MEEPKKAVVANIARDKPGKKSQGVCLTDKNGKEVWVNNFGDRLNYPADKGATVQINNYKKNEYGISCELKKLSAGKGDDVRGKCLCQVICSGINSCQLVCKDQKDINKWVDMMLGKDESAEEPTTEETYQSFKDGLESQEPEDDVPF